MILDCPQCHARFLVADHLIPREGRAVRCGACGSTWHVQNPAAQDEPPATDQFRQLLEEETAPAPADFAATRPGEATANVPAIARRKWPRKPFKIAVPVLALIWIVLAFFAYFPKAMHWPAIGAIYSLFGVTPTDGVAFTDVKMEREQVEGGRTRYVLSGNIVNRTEEERRVPAAHVALNDAIGNALWTRAYPVNITLKPGEAYPFHIVNVETSFAQQVKTITLDLGNSFELMMR